jgi:hypothetical protein
MVGVLIYFSYSKLSNFNAGIGELIRIICPNYKQFGFCLWKYDFMTKIHLKIVHGSLKPISVSIIYPALIMYKLTPSGTGTSLNFPSHSFPIGGINLFSPVVVNVHVFNKQSVL